MNKNDNTGLLISVIMPVYNTQEDFLREAVKSILHQTLADFELLIIDDCSTNPEIEKILKSFDDPRIRLLRTPHNSGAAAARNLGLREAKGKYIAFLDSDDISYKERLAKQAEYLEKHPEIGCLGSASRIIPDNTIQFPPKGCDYLKNYMLFKGCGFCQSSVMLRRRLLTDHKIEYQSQYVPAEDYALQLDLSAVCNLENLDEVLVDYRWHDNNISALQKDKQFNNALRARFRQICKRAKMNDPQFADYLADFAAGKVLTKEKFRLVEKKLPTLINKLGLMGYDTEMFIHELYGILKRNIKKCSDQTYFKLLLKSDLVNYFHIPLLFRAKTYIKKMILGA